MDSKNSAESKMQQMHDQMNETIMRLHQSMQERMQMLELKQMEEIARMQTVGELVPSILKR